MTSMTSRERMRATFAKQPVVGRIYGRFVVSTGSPLTPHTTLQRVQKYIELGHTLSRS